MRKLTKPKVGMIVYLRGLVPEFNIKCEITNIWHHQNNTIFIWVIDANSYRNIGWHPIHYFVEEEDKINWLQEGF